MRILVIEDEPKVASFLKKGLEEQSWEVDLAYDGVIGLSLASQHRYDLLLLDVNLPQMSGIEVARNIRHRGNQLPILMLTALGTTDDKLHGFENGADDYLVKPFEFKELIARIRALHKRTQETVRQATILRIADLEVNTDDKTATRAGFKVELTAKEFTLLTFLLRNKGRVVSRNEIAEKVWGMSFDTGTNVIDVYINFLRKKLDRPFDNKLIHTAVGMGYIMKEDTV